MNTTGIAGSWQRRRDVGVNTGIMERGQTPLLTLSRVEPATIEPGGAQTVHDVRTFAHQLPDQFGAVGFNGSHLPLLS